VLAGHATCLITITLNQIGANDNKTRSGTLHVKDDAAQRVVG